MAGRFAIYAREDCSNKTYSATAVLSVNQVGSSAETKVLHLRVYHVTIVMIGYGMISENGVGPKSGLARSPSAMPPQPGVFALPYASTHNARPDVVHVHHHPVAGPSTRTHGLPTPAHTRPSYSQPVPDDPKRDKKRKDMSGKLGKEMSDRRDESVYPCLSSHHRTHMPSQRQTLCRKHLCPPQRRHTARISP